MKEIIGTAQTEGGWMRKPPNESRKRLLNLITNADRPINLQEVLDVEEKENLWFGPGVDAIDFLFAKQIQGLLDIDLNTDQVIAVPKSRS